MVGLILSMVPDAAYLRECLAYNPLTGALTWKERPLQHFKNEPYQRRCNNAWAGKPAGVLDAKGRLRVRINNRLFLGYRIAWAMQTGKWPGTIDHKDNDPTNNRWTNLREVTRQQNGWNRKPKQRELPEGVSRKRNRFRATAWGDSKTLHLGTFDTAEEAHSAWSSYVLNVRGLT